MKNLELEKSRKARQWDGQGESKGLAAPQHWHLPRFRFKDYGTDIDVRAHNEFDHISLAAPQSDFTTVYYKTPVKSHLSTAFLAEQMAVGGYSWIAPYLTNFLDFAYNRNTRYLRYVLVDDMMLLPFVRTSRGLRLGTEPIALRDRRGRIFMLERKASYGIVQLAHTDIPECDRMPNFDGVRHHDCYDKYSVRRWLNG